MNKKTLLMLALSIFVTSINAQFLTTPTLVKDIANNQQANLSSARCAAIGNQLICSDGSGVGTFVAYTTDAPNATITLPDFYTTASYSILRNNKTYYFTVNTPSNSQLYRYNFLTTELVDNSASITNVRESTHFDRRGIYYLKDQQELWLQKTGESPTLLKNFAGTVTRFMGNEPRLDIVVDETKLWQSDLTVEGTKLLKTFTDLGDFSYNYFAADDGGYNGTEVWTLRTGVTWMISNIAPGVASSKPKHFINSHLGSFFVIDNGDKEEIWEVDYRNQPNAFYTNTPNRGHGNEITAFHYDEERSFRSTNAIYLATQVQPSANFGTTVITSITRTYDSENREHIWTPTDIGEVNGRVTEMDFPYFTVASSLGTALWVIKDSQIQLLLSNASLDNIYSTEYFYDENQFLVQDGKLYYLDYFGDNPLVLVRDFGNNARINFFPEYISSVGDVQIFGVIQNEQTNIWRLNNGVENLMPIEDFSFPNQSFSSSPTNFAKLNGQLYFTAFDPGSGRRVWKSDLTEAGTTALPDWLPSVLSYPNATVYSTNEAIYYRLNIADIWKTTGEDLVLLDPESTEHQEILPLINSDNVNKEYEFYGKTYQVTGGTYYICSRCPRGAFGSLVEVLPDTTRIILSYNTQSYSTPLPPKDLTAFNGKFYFLFNGQNVDGSFNSNGALWESDGTILGTQLVQEFTDRPSNLVLLNDALYVLADDGINGRELLRFDGNNNKSILTNTGTGRNSLSPDALYAYNNRLYFTVVNGDNIELWGNDGLNLGATPLASLKPTPYNSCQNFCGQYYYLNGQLAYTYENPEVGEELFKVDLPAFEVNIEQLDKADLSISQNIERFIGARFTRLKVTMTIQNNGPMTAGSVQVDVGRTNLGFQYRNPEVSIGGFNYGIWDIENLAVGQSATMTYDLYAASQHYGRIELTNTVSSSILDVNTSDNIAYTILETISTCNENSGNGFQIDYFLDEWTEVSPIPFSEDFIPSGTFFQTGGLKGLYNFGDRYTQRATGYLNPTESGNYIFYVSGDDNTDFYLSTNDSPANKTRLAYIDDWTFANEFDKFPYQTSTSVYLEAGQAYYFEVLLSEEQGDDHFAVHWSTPSRPERHLVGNEFLTSTCTGSDDLECTAIDVQHPEIINCPTNFDVYIPAGQPTIATWTPPTATDNCGIASITSTYSPGEVLPYNNTYVSYTITDLIGNETYCGFSVNRITTSPNPLGTNTDQNAPPLLEEEMLSMINLYPSPVQERLQVEIQSMEQDLLVRVINMQGRIVQQLEWTNIKGYSQQSIDVSTLATGAYYVVIGKDTQQFIKL